MEQVSYHRGEGKDCLLRTCHSSQVLGISVKDTFIVPVIHQWSDEYLKRETEDGLNSNNAISSDSLQEENIPQTMWSVRITLKISQY